MYVLAWKKDGRTLYVAETPTRASYYTDNPHEARLYPSRQAAKKALVGKEFILDLEND